MVMLNRKVIATDVTNLTDARYFAARGVDYLLFNMSTLPIDKALEIKEWVEGPELLLLFSKESLQLVDEAIIRLSPAGISAHSKEEVIELSHLSAHVELFKWSADEITIDEFSYMSASHSDDIRAMPDHCGVIIYGGTETAVGMKSFDILDDILDTLEL